MRILHTADWHLGLQLGRIDRTDALRAAVERIAAYCDEHRIDVLIVAGDLFSERARADTLRGIIHHWQTVFAGFLARGGTILTITGNHDNENFCQTLQHAMALAAPTPGTVGERVAPGRFYLAADPTFVKLRDPSDAFDVQFLLMPYPTPTRYLKGPAGQKYSGPEEKMKLLMKAFEQTVRDFEADAKYDTTAPRILVGHVTVFGAASGPGNFTVEYDTVVSPVGLAERFTYVALGHIHRPQALGGHEHVRYSGNIETMELGDKGNAKSVVMFEVGPQGLIGEPELLPLSSTPIHEITILDPGLDLPRLSSEYKDAAMALVHLHVRYTAGVDSLEEVLRQLTVQFPNWYDRDWTENGKLNDSLVMSVDPTGSFAETVRKYLGDELQNHEAAEITAVLERAEALLKECE